MKILNQTTREVNSIIQMTPVSDLIKTSELKDESYLHIIQYVDGSSVDNPKYESMKFNVGAFKEKIYQSVQNTLHRDYWKLHSHVEDDDGGSSDIKCSFKDILDYLGEDAPDPIYEYYETDPENFNFVKHVNYDLEVIRRYAVKKDYQTDQLLGKIIAKYILLEYMFSPDMVLTTTAKNANGNLDVVHESVNHKKSEDDDYCQMVIKEGNKISNTWDVPATGNLVIYGWLDSTDALNNKAIPSSFCVIEGYINNQWEIIGVQTVVPAKTLTYVGFNLNVLKDLKIRARTGFMVGVKSGQYPNEQDGYDTLSNSTPNGFKCQVFSNKKYKDKGYLEKINLPSILEESES